MRNSNDIPSLPKEARGFVNGVMHYLQKEGKPSTAIPKVASLLHKVTTQAQKEKVAYLESSVTLTRQERQMIQRFLGRFLGHTVSVSVSVKPHLLGGFRIHVADWVLDTSYEYQLRCLAEELLH